VGSDNLPLNESLKNNHWSVGGRGLRREPTVIEKVKITVAGVPEAAASSKGPRCFQIRCTPKSVRARRKSRATKKRAGRKRSSQRRRPPAREQGTLKLPIMPDQTRAGHAFPRSQFSVGIKVIDRQTQSATLSKKARRLKSSAGTLKKW